MIPKVVPGSLKLVLCVEENTRKLQVEKGFISKAGTYYMFRKQKKNTKRRT